MIVIQYYDCFFQGGIWPGFNSSSSSASSSLSRTEKNSYNVETGVSIDIFHKSDKYYNIHCFTCYCSIACVHVYLIYML